jgi:hypothetical protein
MIFDPSSVKTAVCPDLLSTLVTVLLTANSVLGLAEDDCTGMKPQLASGKFQMASWLMLINAVCV